MKTDRTRTDSFTQFVPLAVTRAMEIRLHTAAQQMGCLLADVARRGLELALEEIAKNGRLGDLETAPAPTLHPLQISDKTRIRMAELDSALEIELGQGVGETLMAGLLRDIAEGDMGFLEGWIWDNAAEAKAITRRLGRKWQTEDALEPWAQTNEKEAAA